MRDKSYFLYISGWNTANIWPLLQLLELPSIKNNLKHFSKDIILDKAVGRPEGRRGGGG